MKVLIIGGTGHIGANLTRMLVEDRRDVLVVSTGRTPRVADAYYSYIKYAEIEYRQALADGSFLALIQDEQPDVVVDILASDVGAVYDACQTAGVAHIVACGSLWMLGRPRVVPTPEVVQGKCPFAEYQKRYSELLWNCNRIDPDGPACTGILPPNICGPGKIPLDGRGGRALAAHQAHQEGKPVTLPYPGTNLIGPCDAQDVARGFFCAIKNREAATGQIFNVGSAYALTAERFIGTYADIYQTTIPVEYVSAEDYVANIEPDIGRHFHFTEHMCPDISKISSQLGYYPMFTPEESMERAVGWMFDEGLIE